jgi:hypothetical protein
MISLVARPSSCGAKPLAARGASLIPDAEKIT